MANRLPFGSIYRLVRGTVFSWVIICPLALLMFGLRNPPGQVQQVRVESPFAVLDNTLNSLMECVEQYDATGNTSCFLPDWKGEHILANNAFQSASRDVLSQVRYLGDILVSELDQSVHQSQTSSAPPPTKQIKLKFHLVETLLDIVQTTVNRHRTIISRNVAEKAVCDWLEREQRSIWRAKWWASLTISSYNFMLPLLRLLPFISYLATLAEETRLLEAELEKLHDWMLSSYECAKFGATKHQLQRLRDSLKKHGQMAHRALEEIKMIERAYLEIRDWKMAEKHLLRVAMEYLSKVRAIYHRLR
ncbi:hypothetical protein F53441_6884 [Fusarium austroafricanum]|uniref:Uncharacterized protein n=1 Tax=Fusarium austroafricanum TaxID=2364996 RepID=A0A8H4KIR5_9HYPO|nr:hypothetical protein F53441_6884 [Fusarium austroafricanum]